MRAAARRAAVARPRRPARLAAHAPTSPPRARPPRRRAGAAAQWAGAFVAHRLSENLQDRSATTEDARLVELILRVKSELQQSSTEFEEFVCKRLDDVEEQLGHTHSQAAPGGRPG